MLDVTLLALLVLGKNDRRQHMEPKRQLSVRIDHHLLARVKILAKKKGRSVSNLISYLLLQALERDSDE